MSSPTFPQLGAGLPRRRVFAIAGAFLTASALAACGDDDEDGTPTTSASGGAEASTIRLGYFPNITHAPALVGVNKGLFAEALGSTKLDAKTFNAGPAAIEALIS